MSTGVYAVIDYVTKYCLAITITPTGCGGDVLAYLYAAIAEVERVLALDELRDDGGNLEPVDEITGEVFDTAPSAGATCWWTPCSPRSCSNLGSRGAGSR